MPKGPPAAIVLGAAAVEVTVKIRMAVIRYTAAAAVLKMELGKLAVIQHTAVVALLPINRFLQLAEFPLLELKPRVPVPSK